jgi:hypothetical protein
MDSDGEVRWDRLRCEVRRRVVSEGTCQASASGRRRWQERLDRLETQCDEMEIAASAGCWVAGTRYTPASEMLEVQ